MITEHLAALTLEWVREEEQHESYKGTPAKYAQRLNNSFNVNVSVFQMRAALEMLVQARCCRSTPSPLTGGFYHVNWHWGERYFEAMSAAKRAELQSGDPDRAALMDALGEQFPVIQAYYDGGEEWASEVGEVLATSPDLDVLNDLVNSGEIAVPAADRIVTINDNSVRQSFDVKVDQLIVLINQDNELGANLGEDKSRVVGELEAGRSLVKAGRFTTRAIIATALAALTYLATHFADSAIGELAGSMIDMLKPLIGL